jgi:hypothetical protein
MTLAAIYQLGQHNLWLHVENRLKSVSGGVTAYYDTLGCLAEYNTTISTPFLFDGDRMAERDNPSSSKLNGWPGLQSRPPAPSTGESARRFAAIQPCLEPVMHLSLNPTHSARAKVHPLGELAGPLQSCNVLW